MQFYEPARFVFLWLIPLAFLILMGGWRERKKRLGRLGQPEFIEQRLMPEGSSSRRKGAGGTLLMVFFLSTLALARPEWGEEAKKIERKGLDVIFLLDTSLSMLAEDIKPNRLEKAKLEIKNLVGRLRGDRVGMVAFAGSSFLQSPLTLDYSAFFLFVDALRPGYLPTPGTSLARALQLGLRAFPEESGKYRALIVFSDGEDHEGGMEASLQEAQKAGVRIYTVGVGTPEGEPIPLRSPETKKISGYKKDRQDNVVITRLNPELLGRLAGETEGLYLAATAGEKEIEVIVKHLGTLGRRSLKEREITQREDHFQLFLLIAFFLLVGETFFGSRPWRSRPLASKTGWALPFLFLVLTGWIDTSRSLVQEGNRLVVEKKYQSAIENYRKAQVRTPEDPVIRYNLGTSLYQIYEYREGEKELEQALGQAKDPQVKAKIHYNYGNTQYRLGNFEGAIESYKKALEINPKDEDAKYNLEFLQKKKALFEKKQEERQKKEQQQKRPQPQPQQQKQQPSAGGGQDEEQEDQKDQQESQGGGGEEQQEREAREQEEEAEAGEQKLQKPSPEEPGPEPEQRPQTLPKGHEPDQGEREGERQIPLQGQMTKEDALRILDVLREGEKELQDLRRPPVRSDTPVVLKDW